MNCPHCQTPTRPDLEPSYHGEMHECPRCGFKAYFDQWNERGEYQPSGNDPF